MIKFGKKVVKYRILILIIAVLLLIPSFLGYVNTRVNYDILSYLPGDIETMEGQDILVDEFGTGAFSLFIVEGMPEKDVSALKSKIEDVDHVSKVIWYDSALDVTVPMDVLPNSLYQAFNNGDATMMAIIFDDTTSSDETMDAINEIRDFAGDQCFLSGMSAIVTDTKVLSEKETPIYVCIAVVCSLLVFAITMDSFLVPILFLVSIGMAIVYNLGSNYFFGEISYITKALTAVLQLGVTMDYSIFLWHSYKEKKEKYPGDNERAMAHAISNTIVSVVGSSVTTIAGFIALCFMSFTLGLDLGLVMAKGVVFGVICCVTVLPALILTFDKAIQKTSHRALLPSFNGLTKVVTKYFWIFLIVFLALIGPMFYAQNHANVYYNLDETLPKDLDSVVANTKLNEKFNMASTHMVLVNADLTSSQVEKMTKDMERVDGVKAVLGIDSLVGSVIPEDMVPDSIKNLMQNDDYKMMLVMSEYKTASDEVNDQCDKLSTIIKAYDSDGMLVGEAPCTKDLIEITDKDFQTVSIVSIGAIFLIILFVFKSISLPIILVSVIEFAIFCNMGIPYFTGTELPFIASVVIGTIQLGATVDYAILMTSRYKKERSNGVSKKESIRIAHSSSASSIVVSALGFFAATFGVGMYSNIDMISSLCLLMARGAIISMGVVVLLLPTMFIIFDKVICATSIGFKPSKNKQAK